MIIKDILNQEHSCRCIACSIENREITTHGGIIINTNNVVLHQDTEIPIKAFLIIVSQKHIKSISELTYEESQELFNSYVAIA